MKFPFSGELENYPTMNEIWQYYEESPLDEHDKLKTSGYNSNESKNYENKFEKLSLFDGIPVHLSNDTEEKLKDYEHTLTLPQSNLDNVPPQSIDYQMDWKEEQRYLTSDGNANFDPNCTEEVWNITLVPSNLRKNTIYLTVSHLFIIHIL